MKKIKVYASISIVLIMILTINIKTKNSQININGDGIKYAILVNGNPSSEFPIGNYKVSISCTNADAYWNSITEKLIVKNLTENTSCYIEFNNMTNADYLNTYITSLSGTTQGDGQVVSENGLRYEGENPNNYIMFNNELWRILGVFTTEYDSNNSGTADTTANLVKIIRDDSIGGLAWDKSNTNDWPNSSLYHLLNEQYYDWETNKANVSTYCYGYTSTTPAKCNYSIKGIQDGYRNMIVSAKWYLGGGGKDGYQNYTPNNVYNYERNANAIYSGRSASTLGYIGLMYESDYLYGVLANNCSRTTTHGSYTRSKCSGKNWIFSQGYEWTITPSSYNEKHVFHLIWNGVVDTSNGNHGYAVRPTLYLSPDVYRVSGTGTITNPYIIGIAS